MIGYHVTTPAKLARYEATGSILPPVRFWPNRYTADRWAKRVCRTVVLEIDVSGEHWPLPDHIPARWTSSLVRSWRIVNELP